MIPNFLIDRLSLCTAIVKPDTPFSQGNPMAATALKPKAYPGVQLLAAASIEANSVEQALRGAQFRFDRGLHDLRSKFIVRENKLRDEYLAEVAEITAANGA